MAFLTQLADFFLSDIESTAKRNSRSKSFNAETRASFAELTNNISTIRQNLNNDNKVDTGDYEIRTTTRNSTSSKRVNDTSNTKGNQTEYSDPDYDSYCDYNDY